MIGEIIAIGDELTSGRVVDTNSGYAADQLFKAGHEITVITTIGDNPSTIGSALRNSLSRADFLIVTGGLGATSDDLTTEATINSLGLAGAIDQGFLEKLQAKWSGNATRHLQALQKLARLPVGAEALSPNASMAGYLLVHNDRPVFFLPGVPHEMKELLTTQVIPRLSTWPGGNTRHVLQKLYKVFGLPETEINHRLGHLEGTGKGVHLGYYPVFPEVHLSLTIISAEQDGAQSILEEADREIMSTLDCHLFGKDGERMEGVVGELLRKQSKTLSVAESCSGGLLAQKITSVAGSSDYFTGGVVAYSNGMKESLLGVERSILDEYGAVSGPTARAMAAGIRQRSGADMAVSVTGIAGPGGGSDDKPVGTVFFGLANASETRELLFHFRGNRRQIQELTAVTGLDLIRRALLGQPLREDDNPVAG